MLVLKGLIQYYRNDRKDFILSCLFMSMIITVIVVSITLASIMEN